ncbi:MAG: UDP-2,3-diacylglucosamine diphosphatase LpxI [Phycisphaerales bacterium]|nr:UDP-2,3-diacylglucosamine diphosphatase LpxI [Phycisphaerales bacterium]
MSETVIGLIAGEGALPLLVAKGMRRRGHRVVCVAFRGHAHEALEASCDQFAQVSLYRPGGWIRRLRRWGAHEAVMVGRVAKTRMHDRWRLVRDLPDWRAIRLWYRRLRHDRRDRAVLAAVAEELERGGVSLIDSTTHIPEHMASTGRMGRVEPSAMHLADIDLGWPLVQSSADLGVGQSMAIREGDVIAVEAVEGTAAMIERAGSLCPRRGWTLLKTAANDHDLRADVPTIGVETVDQLTRAGAGAIAIGTGRVILLDRDAVIAACDEAGIAIIGVGE